MRKKIPLICEIVKEKSKKNKNYSQVVFRRGFHTTHIDYFHTFQKIYLISTYLKSVKIAMH